MAEEYGEVRTIEPTREVESLKLSFWPGLMPLQQRWRNNGLSADFLADYVTTFFPLDESDPQTRQRQNEVRGAVSYISNELLENAMKFHAPEVAQPISMVLFLAQDRVIFQQSNSATTEAADRFRAFIQKLLECDPNALYLEQLEQNAMSEGSAGMGYLTMLNDYEARLSWRFDPLGESGFMITTQVEIAI